MSNEYRFEELLEVAKWLHAYLEADDRRPKTPLWHLHVEFAKHLLCIKKSGGKWQLSQSKQGIQQRLRSAGLDPETLEIIDPDRAAWAWHQLKTTRRFSQKKQRIFMAGIHGDPPDVSIPFKIAPSGNSRTARENNPVVKHIAAEIMDRLGSDRKRLNLWD